MSIFLSPLSLCVALLAAWGVLGLLGLVRPADTRFVARGLFPLGALCGAALAVAAGAALAMPVEREVLPIGLPDLPVHLRLSLIHI